MDHAQQCRERFGSRVRDCRTVYEWEMEDLATRIGKSASTVSRIENGKVNVSICDLAVIARALAIRPGLLVDEILDECSVNDHETLARNYLKSREELKRGLPK